MRSRTARIPGARELAAATPAGRDRYADLLRVASLGVVVLGHWLMAAVTERGAGNLLTHIPGLQLLTWALQVMPVFFYVGGFSHALAHRSLRRRTPGTPGTPGTSDTSDTSVYAAFLRARLQRLLRPVLVFAAVWGAAALAVQLAGGGHGLTGTALRLVTQPLWFIGVYLAMAALTPPLLRLHERYGWGAFAGLFAGAVAVDLVRFVLAVPYAGFLNFLLVWLAVHQLGFLRADGRITAPAVLAGTGLTGAVLLVALGPYPLSMVGMPGEKVSNMAPPTLALLCHALWLVGAVELLRGPGTRLVARARVWRAVVAANGIAMTAFLWHLTALLGVYGGMLALGAGLPEPATAAWWAQAPARIAAAALLTALLVAVFRRFERPRAAAAGEGPGAADRPRASGRASGRGSGRRSGPLAAAGAVLAVAGVLGLSLTGLAGLLDGHTATLVVIPVTAPAAVALALAGLLLVEHAGRTR
jgi:hypothetical protein